MLPTTVVHSMQFLLTKPNECTLEKGLYSVETIQGIANSFRILCIYLDIVVIHTNAKGQKINFISWLTTQ